jgi:hypothetical protein
MRITLNGMELARRADGEQSVGEVLDELRLEINRGGKVVTQVRLDGRPIPAGWQRRQQLNAHVSSHQSLDLTLEDGITIKQRTLSDATELVVKLVKEAKPLGRKFRIGDEVTANNDLAAFLDDLKLIIEGLDHTTRTPKGSPENPPVRRRVMESANRLLPTLDRIYKAQAAGDYIAIADELEYDLLDQMTDWTDLLAEARRAVDTLPHVE